MAPGMEGGIVVRGRPGTAERQLGNDPIERPNKYQAGAPGFPTTLATRE